MSETHQNSHNPKCPNHHCPMLRTGDNHIWQCPISQALFTVEVNDEDTEIKYDKFGNALKSFTIRGDE